ncbi:creatine kinase B-type-like isoform X1 [Stylophora pistillata]|uniref:Creatine kinase S-type, mitochondrial n=1 Tax=Stylophora pistillata TaxID=50429 RepID=A0A2B4SZI9_STYPI|nr:creatine kinase B-type-like isoform X1 [Stylophora pistillata]PFX33857.1 Creatine kinase S-type, mitochondrial [Stylophora pistillata]
MDVPSSRRFLGLVALGCGVYVAREVYIMYFGEKPWDRKQHGYERYPPRGNFPDLRLHNNMMANHLTPDLYESLRFINTPCGFTLDQAIQVGVDNLGVPWQRASGIIAGDSYSYEEFAPLFDAIIEEYHGHKRKDFHPRDMDSKKIAEGQLNSNYVLSVRLHARRSLRGYALPAGCSRSTRRSLEDLICSVLMRLGGEFVGKYKPIAEFPDPKLGSLNVTSHPTSPLITCSGRARDWPESRGIFRNKDSTFVVFVNEDDHLQFRCFDKGGNLQAVFDKLIRGMAAFERELKKSGEEFIWDDHLGYIVSDPIHLGTALDVRVRVKLHHLSTDSRLRWILKAYKLEKKRSGLSEGEILAGIMYIHNTQTLGMSEVNSIQQLCDAVKRLIVLERMLEQGQDIEDALPLSQISMGKLIGFGTMGS